MFIPFTPFRHCIREPHGNHVKFEIQAVTPHNFLVRFPKYDYIKETPCVSVEYDREQLICFLLAYDEAECLEFMEKLYGCMGAPQKKIAALRDNPAFSRLKGE